MARIYTKTGDKGDTGLIGGSRQSKNSPLIDAIGEVDETNAAIGVAVSAFHTSTLPWVEAPDLLGTIQSRLFDIGAALADVEGRLSAAPIVSWIEQLEGNIDHFEAELPPLRKFILPGGTPLAAHLHLARSVCRRAERAVVALREERTADCVKYLNRLSDLLFVLARTANHRAGVQDIEWTQEDAKP